MRGLSGCWLRNKGYDVECSCHLDQKPGWFGLVSNRLFVAMRYHWSACKTNFPFRDVDLRTSRHRMVRYLVHWCYHDTTHLLDLQRSVTGRLVAALPGKIVEDAANKLV
jgi:hypothetical protein